MPHKGNHHNLYSICPLANNQVVQNCIDKWQHFPAYIQNVGCNGGISSFHALSRTDFYFLKNATVLGLMPGEVEKLNFFLPVLSKQKTTPELEKSFESVI